MVHARPSPSRGRPVISPSGGNGRYDRGVTLTAACRVGRLIVIALLALPAVSSGAAAGGAVATPAPARVVSEVAAAVELARARFEARDLAGVLAWVSEGYRSGGLTKAGVREQLAAMFALYAQLRARVSVDRVELVDQAVWVYTTGEISGRLPVVGWVSVLTWQGEPEVARREPTGWRLFGFQD